MSIFSVCCNAVQLFHSFIVLCLRNMLGKSVLAFCVVRELLVQLLGQSSIEVANQSREERRRRMNLCLIFRVEAVISLSELLRSSLPFVAAVR